MVRGGAARYDTAMVSGGRWPDLDQTASACVRNTSCEDLRAHGVCERARVLSERSAMGASALQAMILVGCAR